MKILKLGLTVVLLLLLVSAIVGFAVSRRSAKNRSPIRTTVMTTVNAKSLTVRDFPEEGIIIRHMGDPKHRQEAEYMFQSPPELRAATNQYSFVIENTSEKTIIALSIAFSFPKPGQSNPTIGTIRTNSLQARLAGSKNASLMLSGSKVGYCLALGQENLDFKNGIRYIQPERPTTPGMTEEQRQQLNEAIRSQFNNLDNNLSECEHWEVEIEGAVFDDGTFVGTNRRNYFEQMSAKVEGGRRMAKELTEKIEKGESQANLVAHAQVHAKTRWEDLLKPFGGSVADAMQDEAYNFQFSKNMVAHRFTIMGEAERKNYLKHVEHWPKLKKK